MAMVTDVDYILQAIRLSTLRHCDDPITARVVSLEPTFSVNPFISASGLADIDRWPEIKRALDSPPPSPSDESSADEGVRRRRRAQSDRQAGQAGPSASGGGLKYTQTIMPAGRSGAAGMRVSADRRNGRPSTRDRANSSSVTGVPSSVDGDVKLPVASNGVTDDIFTPKFARPRSDSAPAPSLRQALGSSLIRGQMGTIDDENENTLSLSAASIDETLDDDEDLTRSTGLGVATYDGEGSSVGIGQSARPNRLVLTNVGGDEMVDEGSDVDEDELFEDAQALPPIPIGKPPLDRRKTMPTVEEDRRSSVGTTASQGDQLDFAPVPLLVRPANERRPSALTAALNKHVPHLVSTSVAPSALTLSNPFASLYASVAAPASAPSISLELYFPHSREPTKPLVAKVRKDTTVEEATGYGLYKYWEDGREPHFDEEDSEEKLSTIGWGLRIVEDDGEVDEDFPPLDRDSQISKFSYGQFAIVEATATQVKQNAAKAPHIVRRPSRIIAGPSRLRPAQAGMPHIGRQPSAQSSTTSLSSTEQLLSVTSPAMGSTALKGSVGLSSTLSKPVLLRVRVAASVDVHFTTTISVPADMYIADLTEVLCKKKRLQMPYSDWVLCLADLSLALPLDRTVASLEGKTDLALVRRQWAVEHGLRIGDRRGGDPNASIFRRASAQPAGLQRAGGMITTGAPGVSDFSQTYKKYTVQRRIAIGRHERVLAIDGDYIHIMPSESRAFFDSMKTTSFHITLVANAKLSGRAGGFKINVWREGGVKRYEFEAENGKQASEIVTTIRTLMKQYQSERSSMLPPPRAERR